MIAASEKAQRPFLEGYSGETVLKSKDGKSLDMVGIEVPVSQGLSEFSRRKR